MKLIELKIKGINSYLDEQTIDFEKLTQNGVFGIFGTTGSGKSTILDAIILSLYDKIPRYTGNNVPKDFINKNANDAYVKFTFSLLSDGTRKTYVIERGYKRDKSGSVVTTFAKLYSLQNSEPIIITDKPSEVSKEVEKALGLEYSDFTRSVILPQGKFNEFLNLKSRERLAMLENLFNLKEYGNVLSEKIKTALNSETNALDKILLNLQYYMDVTEENISLLGSNILAIEQELNTIKEEYERLNNIKETNFVIIEKIKNFNKIELELTILLKQKNDIDALKTKIEKNNNITTIKPILDEVKEVTEKLTISEYKLKALQEEKKLLESEYIICKNNFENSKREKDENYKIITNDIGNAKESLSNLSFIEDFQSQLLTLSNSLLAEESIYKKFNIEKKQLEDDIGAKKETLQAIGLQKKELNKKLLYSNVIEENKNKELELSKLRDNLSALQKDYDDTVLLYRNTNAYYKTLISEKNTIIQNSIDSLNKKINEKITLTKELEKKEQNKFDTAIYEITKTLKDGDLCPICQNKYTLSSYSSSKNSSPVDFEEIDIIKSKIDVLTSEITTIEDNLHMYQVDIASHEYIKPEKQLYNFTPNQLSIEIGVTDEKLKNIIARGNELKDKKTLESEKISLLEKELNPIKEKLSIENFLYEYNKLQDYKVLKDNLELQEENLRSTLENLDKNYNLSNQKLSNSETQINILKNSIFEKEKLIKTYKDKITKLIGNNAPSIFLSEKEAQLEQLDKNLEIATANKDKNLEDRNINANNITLITETMKNLNNILQKNEEELLIFLKNNNYENIEQLELDILSNEYYLASLKKVEDFFQLFTPTNLRYEDLLKELSDVNKDEVLSYQDEIIKNINGLTEKKEALTKDMALTHAKYDDYIKKFEEAKLLNSEKARLEKRLDSIKNLQSLFRKNAFVEYISQYQLEYITKESSKKLKEMTSNRFTLELDDSNFVVVDHFNGGVRRSTRTLSGGETFIVSLCLSLALSSNIQLKNNATLETFFLDEGFGTLDNALLDSVLDSLFQLNKEKISIGLISHVEEIKNRLPRKLVVTNDNVSGNSIVSIE